MSDESTPRTQLPDAPLQATIEAALLSRGLDYDVEATPAGFRSRLGFKTEVGFWQVDVDLNVDEPAIVVNARPDLVVPEERRAETLAFVAHVNEATILASWQLRPDTGATELRTWLDGSALHRIPPDAVERLVDRVMHIGIATRPALEAVAFRGLDAMAAFRTTPPGRLRGANRDEG